MRGFNRKPGLVEINPNLPLTRSNPDGQGGELISLKEIGVQLADAKIMGNEDEFLDCLYMIRNIAYHIIKTIENGDLDKEWKEFQKTDVSL